jgi:hypothetical protein
MTIIFLLAALGAAALLLVARRPATFRVQRSTHIAASPEAIRPLISDLRRFNTWNPYANNRPLQLSYSGPDSGPGAAYAFSAGRSGGSVAVLDSAPEKVTMRLHMSGPVRCDHTLEFLLAPGVGGTEVTWAMHGRNGFLGKLMGLLCDTDRMVGRDFETGLAALKLQAEAD